MARWPWAVVGALAAAGGVAGGGRLLPGQSSLALDRVVAADRARVFAALPGVAERPPAGVEVTDLRPGQSATYALERGGASIRRRVVLTPVPEGTLVRLSETRSMPGAAARWVGWVEGPDEAGAERWIADLGAAASARPPRAPVVVALEVPAGVDAGLVAVALGHLRDAGAPVLLLPDPGAEVRPEWRRAAAAVRDRGPSDPLPLAPTVAAPSPEAVEAAEPALIAAARAAAEGGWLRVRAGPVAAAHLDAALAALAADGIGFRAPPAVVEPSPP